MEAILGVLGGGLAIFILYLAWQGAKVMLDYRRIADSAEKALEKGKKRPKK